MKRNQRILFMNLRFSFFMKKYRLNLFKKSVFLFFVKKRLRHTPTTN